MTVRFLKVAQVELREAVRYDESQAAGLGAAWGQYDISLRGCEL